MKTKTKKPQTLTSTSTDIAVPSVEAEPLTDLENHHRLEAKMISGKRAMAEALREIVRDKTYKAEGYEALEDYLARRWSMVRNTAYSAIAWINAVEFLESKGVANPLQNLSVEAAKVFRQHANQPEVFFVAYQRLAERGEEPTAERLQEAAKFQHAYNSVRNPSFGTGLDITEEEYAAYRRLDGLEETSVHAKDSGELVKKCIKLKKKPDLHNLHGMYAKGPPFIAFCRQLERALIVSDAVKRLQEKRRQLDAEIEAEKKKAETPETPPTPPAEDLQLVNPPAAPEEDEEEDSELEETGPQEVLLAIGCRFTLDTLNVVDVINALQDGNAKLSITAGEMVLEIGEQMVIADNLRFDDGGHVGLEFDEPDEEDEEGGDE